MATVEFGHKLYDMNGRFLGVVASFQNEKTVRFHAMRDGAVSAGIVVPVEDIVMKGGKPCVDVDIRWPTDAKG